MKRRRVEWCPGSGRAPRTIMLPPNGEFRGIGQCDFCGRALSLTLRRRMYHHRKP